MISRSYVRYWLNNPVIVNTILAIGALVFRLVDLWQDDNSLTNMDRGDWLSLIFLGSFLFMNLYPLLMSRAKIEGGFWFFKSVKNADPNGKSISTLHALHETIRMVDVEFKKKNDKNPTIMVTFSDAGENRTVLLDKKFVDSKKLISDLGMFSPALLSENARKYFESILEKRVNKQR
ncbi:hypothetical protein K8I28_09380 [bacterium]|nr:hypothetical protein [bacterium]